MKPFRYAVDPLCITCCGLYAANRWLWMPNLHSRFMRGHFNNLLLIPCALPVILWLQRQLGWRNTDETPTLADVLFHLAIWSVLFEAIGPHLLRTTGDIYDVLAYAAGAFIALLWWRTGRISKPAA